MKYWSGLISSVDYNGNGFSLGGCYYVLNIPSSNLIMLVLNILSDPSNIKMSIKSLPDGWYKIQQERIINGD